MSNLRLVASQASNVMFLNMEYGTSFVVDGSNVDFFFFKRTGQPSCSVAYILKFSDNFAHD